MDSHAGSRVRARWYEIAPRDDDLTRSHSGFIGTWRGDSHTARNIGEAHRGVDASISAGEAV